MRIGVLGPLRVLADGGPVHIGGLRLRALLAGSPWTPVGGRPAQPREAPDRVRR
ncbi:hypothetical protein [Amycolatopsis cihanbeyliensis]|uniref:Uncharacterized protein n=1 Tax=Amycolatopsis cihanbeyliensis TaxID=1128664 RepID=A0A542DPX8_AMYCI|nr:hypothetical protein [Amycolatopsis cihanbeyliensis]TQJ05161.1 hypothetical protein FB471_4986 [Amycolatopsis cihanbeyliensis]